MDENYIPRNCKKWKIQKGKETMPNIRITAKYSLKRYLNDREMRMANTLYDMFEKKVKDDIDKAIFRAKENGRTTVMERDF